MFGALRRAEGEERRGSGWGVTWGLMLLESDHGVPEDVAHFYFTQLVSGLSYIHGEGIAHRGKQDPQGREYFDEC